MISLTFGEQVKIVLSRKGMTIKELAERIQEETGRKMSRQNLTQRLGRDNFQEQDMRAIADILGCSFQLSILASAEAVQKASVVEGKRPTPRELHKIRVKKEQKKAREEAREQAERDITIGEFVEMMENPVPTQESPTEQAAMPEESVPVDSDEKKETTGKTPEAEAGLPQEAEVTIQVTAETDREPGADTEHAADAEHTADTEHVIDMDVIDTDEPEATENAWEIISIKEQAVQEMPEPEAEEEQRGSKFNKIANIISGPQHKHSGRTGSRFEPIKRRSDEEEDIQVGDVNPYTGHEYQTNSVRTHPKRIGYVQVYDRKEHKWTDMTEWAFLGMEERKRAMLGNDYEPPVYLD